MTPNTLEILSRLSTAAVIMENLPELPGHNGSVLTIDDTEAEEIAKAIDSGIAEIERLKKLAYLAEGLRITKSDDMGIFLHFETASGKKSGLRLDSVGAEWALEKLADALLDAKERRME